MIRKLFLTGALVAAGTISGARTSEAQAGPPNLKWFPEKAIVGPGECPGPGEVQFIASGPDLTVLFRNLGIHLERGSGALAASRRCTIRVPFMVPAGARRTMLTQAITYGVDKSTSSTGEIKTVGTFLDQPSPPFDITIPKGAMRKPMVVEKMPHLVMLDACGGRAKDGLYKADVALSVRRDNVNEEIFVGGGRGIDFRYDVTSSVIVPCFM